MLRMGLRPIVLLGLAVVVACGEEFPAPNVVALVAGEDLELAAFEGYLDESSIDLDAGLDSRVLTQLFDQFLDETLVRALAVDEGLASEQASRRTALEALVDDRLAAEIPAERVLLHYRKHREQFDLSERVRLSQILVAERAAAENALEELGAGAPFDEVARRISIDPAAQIGGDQGFLTRRDLPPAFVETVFGLEAGEISEVVAADYGFHIFLVTEHRAAEEVPFAAVAAEIEGQLRREEQEGLRASLVEEARERYNTKVYASNLPFEYQGSYPNGDSD